MINIKRILCPTDLSPHSGDAVRYALALSRAHDAELILLYCTDDVGGEDKLAASVMDHIDPSDSRWRLVVTRTADVDQGIMAQAQQRHVDLIVMRSRPCPVLVVHTDEREFVSDAMSVELKRVLVAYDFSDYSELALKYGLSIAQEHQAELHLLHVLPPRSLNDPEIAWYPVKGESAYHTASYRLQKVVPGEAHLWCGVRTVVSEGYPYREILNYAENNEIDLISVGAHGAGFGMRALFGSNVDRVLRQAPCPVLVARPLRPIMPIDLTLPETRLIHTGV
jgi:nucleotide-binding universal stress UspA family protein